MRWLVIAIIIMFVIVSIIASFFKSGVNKGGGLVITGVARQDGGLDKQEDGRGFYRGTWWVYWERE